MFSFFVFQDLNNLAALVRGQLPKLTRNILCALITIDVHARYGLSIVLNSPVESLLIAQQSLRFVALFHQVNPVTRNIRP